MRASERICRAVAAAALVSFVLGLAPAEAQQRDDVESRLRAALRTATAQLRDLQDQNATLLAKQAEAERQRLALTQQLADRDKVLAELGQHSKASDVALQQSAARLQTQQGNFSKLEGYYKEAVEVARARDTEIKRIDATLGATRQRVQTCETKNAELYKLGEQVLDLYDKKGVIDSLVADEPVTKLKRVEFENLMQDYEDKLRAQEINRPAQ